MSAEHRHPGTDDQAAVVAGHELTDAQAAPALKFIVFLLVTTLLIAAAMVFVYNYLEHREAAAKAPRYPLAAGRPAALPPPPRLQHHPFVDVQALRREEARLLEGYEWVDQTAGTVRIPVDRALEVLAERGLPHRAAAPAPVVPGATAAGAGPLTPTRAASGREPIAAPEAQAPPEPQAPQPEAKEPH